MKIENEFLLEIHAEAKQRAIVRFKQELLEKQDFETLQKLEEIKE